MAKKLKVGYLPIIDHLILGITKNKIDNGLEDTPDIELVEKFGWNEVGDALMEGSIDMAFMLAPYAMDLYHTKQNIKLLLLSHRDGSIIVTNKRANINNLQDFKGKTVLIPYQASMHHVIFHKLLQEAGLSLGIGKDVVTEVVAPGQIPMMIEYDQEGTIAGYIVAEPFGTVVVNGGHGDILKLSKDVTPAHPCCGVVVRDEVIAEHRDTVQALINSFVKSGLEVKSDKENTIKTAVSFMKQPEEVVRAILEDPSERFTADRLMPTLEELDAAQNYLIDTVSMPAISGKIDMSKFVDLSFAQAAGAK
ncbi:MAG: ABC transporter substrate-binding protein [Defluviitaleaceae bacterium]|nr:ABC transporter substrate-binding protein [Defluviitaleaceae bacterium]